MQSKQKPKAKGRPKTSTSLAQLLVDETYLTTYEVDMCKLRAARKPSSKKAVLKAQQAEQQPFRTIYGAAFKTLPAATKNESLQLPREHTFQKRGYGSDLKSTYMDCFDETVMTLPTKLYNKRKELAQNTTLAKSIMGENNMAPEQTYRSTYNSQNHIINLAFKQYVSEANKRALKLTQAAEGEQTTEPKSSMKAKNERGQKKGKAARKRTSYSRKDQTQQSVKERTRQII